MEEWVQRMKKADFDGIARRYGISVILARLIVNRGLFSHKEIEEYLNGTQADLFDGAKMADMEKAAGIILEKIRKKLPIRVIGDYDVDGVNAAYILQNGINDLGGRVDTDIPDRVKDGFGLNRHLIDRALRDGIDTVLTCDNGIAASEEISYGKKKGMTLVVTDHHEVPFREEKGERRYVLPEADAVVDPMRADCPYPFKGLCGAAVAYKFVEALYRSANQDAAPLQRFIENVGIATVGDVMDLKDENRIFVKEGLKRLANTENCGLRALMDCTGMNPKNITAYQIGYVLGPCLNAGGRLDSAKKSLALLNAPCRSRAQKLAEELKALNDERKKITETGVEKAIEQIEGSSLKDDRILVVYLPESHESVAGIIAGRIREKYGRPVFILTDSKDCVKGSGRSIDAYNMIEEMNRIAGLFIKFGGHKAAAGLSIKKENIDIFREKINAWAMLSDRDFCKKVRIDMRLPFSYITDKLTEELQKLEPCGKGNEKPLFAETNVMVRSARVVGKERTALVFTVIDGQGTAMNAVYFGDAKACLSYIQNHERMSFTFYPRMNEYKGYQNLQLVMVNYR